MQLADLPQFTIERIEQDGEESRLFGRLDRFRGVRQQNSWLFAPAGLIGGKMIFFDETLRTAVFVADYCNDACKVGAVLPWTQSSCNPQLVELILNPETDWKNVVFASDDAMGFTLGSVRGRTKVGSPLPEGSEAQDIIHGGWDHEHCDVCWARIGPSDVAFKSEKFWLCVDCQEKHATPSDISFMYYE